MRRSKRCTQASGVHNGTVVNNTAIAYVRVSTQEQANKGVSLDAQRERIEAYAQLAGLTVVQIISDDGVSGAKRFDSRPGGIAVAEQIAAGCTNVVALKLDRLFRDAEDALRQTREWERAGATLHIIDMGGGSLNTASPMGRMFLTIIAALAEWERNLIRERTATALQHKKSHLKAYSPTPYGFQRNGAELVSDDTESDIIARLKAWDSEGIPLRGMADRLNAAGTPTKRGGLKWYASTVAKILDNTLHA